MAAAKQPTMDVPLKHYSIDFEILSVLSDGRNVPSIIADDIDNSRNYVSNRLRQLRDYGMVEEVAPDTNVGLYEITGLGETALQHRDLWESNSDEYRQVIEETEG